jgi:NAD(P)-dependent dehydrogenase (short-subunit alcohol dehydrogenase family)
MTETSEFVGSSVVVTGGSRGIGLAIAKRFAAAGASLLISTLSHDEGSAALETLNAQAIAGRRAELILADVQSRPDTERLIDAAITRFGRLDVVVANAGIAEAQPLLELSDAVWAEIMNVNLSGTFMTIQTAARAMATRGGGRIIAIASTNAFWMESNLAAYNASKAGIVALARTAAIEWARHGITVNVVAPGQILTRMTEPLTADPIRAQEYLTQIPLGRFGSPDDVAAAVAYLASRDAAWVTGHVLVVDGGQTLGAELAPLAKRLEEQR